jgi:hypothetical protein
MSTTLDQVLASLNSVYDPQVQSVQAQQAALPTQTASQVSALGAQKDQAYNDILDGARSRGVGFGGIPLAEQAKYNATTYAPAVANLYAAQDSQAKSLTDALNSINQNKYNQAQSIYQYQTSLEEQQREFDAQQRSAASNAFAPSYSAAPMPTIAGNPASASAIARSDGGFNYTDSSGRPISAAAYAAAKGLAFRDVLSAAAKAGDKGAQTALGFVGNDYGYDPSKINSKQLADLYNSLVWGTGKSASFKPSIAVKTPTQPVSVGALKINNPLAVKSATGAYY